MQISKTCYKCPMDIETPDHILRLSSAAKIIWHTLAQFLPSNCQENLLKGSPFKLWLKSNLTDNTNMFLNISWSSIFAFSGWLLWKARKKNVLQNDKQQPPSLHHIIKVASKFIHIKQNHKLISSTIVTHFIKSYPPIALCIKLNVDGAFTPANSYGGAGGVLRNSKGEWLLGFSCGFHCTSSNQVEFLALKQGLNLAISLGITHLEINSYSKVLIQSLVQKIAPSNLSILMNDGRCLLHRLQNKKYSHVFREPNTKQCLTCWQKMEISVLRFCQFIVTLLLCFSCFQ